MPIANPYVRRYHPLSDPSVYRSKPYTRGQYKGCPLYYLDKVRGAKALVRIFPLWSKEWHREASVYWTARAARCERLWANGLDRAFRATFGRAPAFGECYKISGIGREEFSESTKRRLRILSHALSDMRTIAAAHIHAAKYYAQA